MFDALRDFFRSFSGESDRREDGLSVEDPRVAAAALLVHVSDADGEVTQTERRRLEAVLAEEFGLNPAEAARIAQAGREADAEAVDLYTFTNVLKQNLGEEERVRFVQRLWEITYADGEVHELEDNIIWRISELLGVSTRDRMLSKRDVAARSDASED